MFGVSTIIFGLLSFPPWLASPLGDQPRLILTTPHGQIESLSPYGFASIQTLPDFAREHLAQRLIEHKKYNQGGIVVAPLQAFSSYFVDKLQAQSHLEASRDIFRIHWRKQDLQQAFEDIMREELRTMTDDRVTGLYQIALAIAESRSRILKGQSLTAEDRQDLSDAMARILAMYGAGSFHHDKFTASLRPDVVEKLKFWELMPDTQVSKSIWREFFWLRGPVHPGLSIQTISPLVSVPLHPAKRAIWYLHERGLSSKEILSRVIEVAYQLDPSVARMIPDEEFKTFVSDFLAYPERNSLERFRLMKLLRKRLAISEEKRMEAMKSLSRLIRRSINYTISGTRTALRTSLVLPLGIRGEPTVVTSEPHRVPNSPQTPHEILGQKLAEAVFGGRDSLEFVDVDLRASGETQPVGFDSLDSLSSYAIDTAVKAFEERRLHDSTPLIVNHGLPRGRESAAHLFYAALSQEYLSDNVIAGGFQEFLARIKRGMQSRANLDANKIFLYYQLYVATLATLAAGITSEADFERSVIELTQIDRPQEILRAYQLDVFDARGEVTSFWRHWDATAVSVSGLRSQDDQGRLQPKDARNVRDPAVIREELSKLRHSRRPASDIDRVADNLRSQDTTALQVRDLLMANLDWEILEQKNSDRPLSETQRFEIASALYGISGGAESLTKFRESIKRLRLHADAEQAAYEQAQALIYLEAVTPGAAQSMDLRHLCRTHLAAFGATKSKAQAQ